MKWSWKSFGLHFTCALVLGMGLASWTTTVMEARRGPDAPTSVLFAMMVGGLLAPIVPSALSGWKGWGLNPLLVANLAAPALYSGVLAVGVLSLIVAIICYLGAQQARAIVFYYSPAADVKSDASDP